MKIFRNIRFLILLTSVCISLAVYLFVMFFVPSGSTQVVKLTESYALISLGYLYLTLLAGPFCYTFGWFAYQGLYLKARRALGVSTFYFALLHAGISFFAQLGGFNGLSFLTSGYLWAIIFGAVALFIFSLLALTSFDFAVSKLTFTKWKLLHRFIYLAGIFVLAHAVMLGAHFSNLSNGVSQITFVALAFLLLLEAPRLDKLLFKRFKVPQFGISFLMLALLLTAFYFSVIKQSFGTSAVSFDIHAAHRQLAQTTQQQSTFANNSKLNTIPGLNGDRNKRYTVSIATDPPNPQAGQDVTVRFSIYDATNGNRVSLFRLLYEKPMHFIIVNNSLTYFSHIHPVQQGSDFVITTQFPKDDMYHLYITFYPYGGIEQQVGFSLPIGQVPNPLSVSNSKPDASQTKTFSNYAVSVNTHGTLKASAMSLGQQTITFTVKDAKTGQPITNLKPYLAAFGHLTMINQQTFDFIHVHPYNLTPPAPTANGGPTVDFLPIGIYGPFTPGTYRAFAEFNPDGNLFTADFTINLE
ncbi:MAG TPA: ferric reductase-like transmembrane domain-containing protein [Candidatus Saccharimonadales bacterium]|nr:ferric reductase-like transmembrane domain-containing protein [Candidatus Saccharimonadales bacterium]